jgi:hypothetical protein
LVEATPSLVVVSGYWLPAWEAEAVDSELLAESGGEVGDHAAFKRAVRFRDAGGELTALVGSRWCPRSLPSSPGERRMRRPWMVFAIVATPTQYVIWKIDTGTHRRVGDGWRIAARVPLDDVVDVREFPLPRDGRLLFVRQGAEAHETSDESLASVALEVEAVEALVADDPHAALLRILKGVHGADREGAGVVPVGPLLALLHDDGLWFEIEILGRSDPLFRRVLRMVRAYDSAGHDRLDVLLAQFTELDVNDR